MKNYLKKTILTRMIFFVFLLSLTLILLLFSQQKKITFKSKAANTKAKTAAVIFSWYYCPPDGKTCIPERWAHKPPNINSYNPENPDWWQMQTADMTCAGIDLALIYIWDSGVWESAIESEKYKYINNIKAMTAAIQQQNSPLKIAEFWDASYAGSGSLADLENAKNHYLRFIKPFYQLVPANLWAKEAGKPILVAYRFGSDNFTAVEKAADFFQNIKNFFKSDFGVEPFLILGSEWFKTSAAKIADGQLEIFNGSVACDGNARSHSQNGYTITSVSAGGQDFRPEGCRLKRQQDSVFKKSLNQVPENANLIVVESWNELGEGSGIERATNYPKDADGFLPQTYYMDVLRTYLGKSDRPACQTTIDSTIKPTSQSTQSPQISGGAQIIFIPTSPAANTPFKISNSSNIPYVWVHQKIFDISGENLVWEAPKDGSQPKVSKSGQGYQWLFEVKGLVEGIYKVSFYVNCHTGCQEIKSTTLAVGSTPTVTVSPEQEKGEIVLLKDHLSNLALLPKDKADQLKIAKSAIPPLVEFLKILKKDCPFPYISASDLFSVNLFCFDYEKIQTNEALVFRIKDKFVPLPEEAKNKAGQFGLFFEKADDPSFIKIKPAQQK